MNTNIIFISTIWFSYILFFMLIVVMLNYIDEYFKCSDNYKDIKMWVVILVTYFIVTNFFIICISLFI